MDDRPRLANLDRDPDLFEMARTNHTPTERWRAPGVAPTMKGHLGF